MKMKKLLSLLLALVMTLSLLTLPSYAEEDDAAPADAPAVEQTEPTQSAEPTEDAEQPTEDEKTTEQPTESAEPGTPVTEPTEQPTENEKTTEPTTEPEENPAPVEDVTPDEDGLEYDGVVTGTMASSIVDYTNVAPLEDAKASAPVRKTSKSALMKSGAATYVPVAPVFEKGKTADGLVMKKTATGNANGGYDIKLEAYTTGTVSTSTEAVPTDIILVLDQSGSMDNTYTSVTETRFNPVTETSNYTLRRMSDLFVQLSDGETFSRLEVGTDWSIGFGNIRVTYTYIWEDENGVEQKATSQSGNLLNVLNMDFGTRPSVLNGKIYQANTTSTDVSRLQALKNSATDFINAVQQDAVTNNVDHRIAVVGFASSGTNYSDDAWENTELLSTQNVESFGKRNGLTAEDYRNALVSANSNGSVNSRLTTAVSRLDANGGTWINYGLEMAQGIFNNTDGTGRNRVVVVLTDGTPGNGTWGNTVTGNTCASDALSKATALKNSGVVIYTVGIFDGADATSAGANSGTTAQKSNYFMQNMSSNNGAVRDPGYYLSASNQTALKNIFTKISQEISTPSISLNSSTVVRDIVSPYFDMPAKSAVSVKSYDCLSYNATTGAATWNNTGASVPDAVSVSGTTIDVSKFDFNANFISENGRGDNNNFYGRKLEITFTVTPKDGFWGGNNVPTNGNQSGVYVGNEQIATFDVPTVNVPLNVPDLIGSNKNIYLLNDAPSATDLGTFDVPTGDDAWKVAYVNIGPITADKDISNTKNTENITLSVTVTPLYTGEDASGTVQEAVKKTATANVYVFKPELTYKDSTVYYGATAPTQADYDNNNLVKPIEWKNGETLSTETGVTMIGTAPTLTLTYTPDSGVKDGIINTKQDIPVKATVKIGSDDVTTDTTFLHQDCTGETWTATNGDPAFLLHVKTCTLTISKQAAQGTTFDENQSFIFTVNGGAITQNIKVTVQENGSVTITGLPVGSYTVTEDGNWSWRYKVVKQNDADGTVTLSAGENSDSATVTITNERVKPKWLSGSAFAINRAGGRVDNAAPAVNN